MSHPKRTLPVAAAVSAALLAGGCAQITATDADLPAPAASVALTASAANGLFSSIAGAVTVQSATLKHLAAAAPPPGFANTGTSGPSVTFTFTAAPQFLNGDVLTVTWSADAVPLVGSHYQVQRTATYRFHGRVGK
jgi:hypothetical protein